MLKQFLLFIEHSRKGGMGVRKHVSTIDGVGEIA